jgi:tetratricopeptide (TPR) repeat protein
MLATALLGAASAAEAQTASRQMRVAPSASPAFQALAAKAAAARDAERLDEAVALYRKALALNPRWTEGWWSLGTLYYDSDRYTSAMGAFQKVVVLDPRQGTARAMFGLSEFELGQDENALRDIEASKSLGIMEDQQLRQVVLFHEGVLLQRASRFEGAQKALYSLCQSRVTCKEVTLTLGMVVLRMHDHIPPVPGSANAEIVEHMGRGACLAAQKNYDEARKEYGVILAGSPHTPYAHYAYGRLLLEARDTPSAILEFQQEIEEAPGNVLPGSRLAPPSTRWIPPPDYRMRRKQSVWRRNCPFRTIC